MSSPEFESRLVENIRLQQDRIVMTHQDMMIGIFGTEILMNALDQAKENEENPAVENSDLTDDPYPEHSPDIAEVVEDTGFFIHGLARRNTSHIKGYDLLNISPLNIDFETHDSHPDKTVTVKNLTVWPFRGEGEIEETQVTVSYDIDNPGVLDARDETTEEPGLQLYNIFEYLKRYSKSLREVAEMPADKLREAAEKELGSGVLPRPEDLLSD